MGKMNSGNGLLAQFKLGRRIRHYWETVTECSIRHSFLDVEYDIPID